MNRFRLALASLALALAATGGTASADDTGCPSAYQAVMPYGTCAWTGRGANCSSCTYDCQNGEYTWDMCGVAT
jgi:hypothetical protein